MKKTIKALAYLILLGMVSCIEPYEKTFKTSSNIIIVEGLITNDFATTPILLKESVPSETGSSRLLPIKGAVVNLLVNGESKIPLNEKTEGEYYLDPTFKGEIGKKYKLQFTTADGNMYESTEEALPVAVDIKKVSHQLVDKLITDAQGNGRAGYKLFVDVDDPASQANQYMWGWTIYERQSVCKTCTGSYYYTTPAPLGSCVDDAILKRYNNIFDYNCTGNCWDIVRSSDLFISRDEFYNGGTLKSQYVGKIPVYTFSGALVEMSQYSISRAAYDFINLSLQQGVQTGGLADTPPAQLTGNIKCLTDPSINTSGFFVVAGKSKFKYWLDKADAYESKVSPLGLFGGRELKLEPAGPNTTRPPLAPCVNSLTRTNQQPEGWIN
jgi:hypothetical protein